MKEDLSLTDKTYRPRLSVEISDEQQLKLQKYLDHGMQKKLFNIVVDDVIKMLEKHGRNFLAAVIMHKLSYTEYNSLEVLNEIKDTKDNG
jgi:hypothetical protein